MKRLLKTLAAGLKGPRKSRPAPRARLGVESLEDRRLLSAYPITDMTQWAQQLPAPAHSQTLSINFDGKHNDGKNISAFVAGPGQNRDAAIQDILYRVAETFSPFDVQVRRVTGDGNYLKANGETTIFVGGDADNVSAPPGGFFYTKSAASYTPANFVDYAHPSNLDHAPNSLPYHLAFVDPMSVASFNTTAFDPATWTNTWSDAYLVSNITHEAGHTFGLAHVRTDGLVDPAKLGVSTLGDIMSYNTDLPQTLFANSSLPVTTFNYRPATGTNLDPTQQPVSHLDVNLGNRTIETPVNITTQNSFTYLQTVLGKRYSDGYVHASDPNTVDPSSTNTRAPWFIGPGSGISIITTGTGGTHGVLGRAGDFDAFQLTPTKAALQFHIDVTPDPGTYMYPDILVKDGSGNVLFFTHAANYWTVAHLDFQAAAGQTYVVVVGSENTYGSGGFKITATVSDPVPVLTGATFTFSSPALPGAVGRLVVQSEDVNSGVFSGWYYNFFGMRTPVWGQVSNTSVVNGVTTSDFSFNGSATGGGLWAIAQYSGKLTGKGSPSGYGWADTVDGTLIDEVFLLPSMSPLWIWGGPAKGVDF